MTIPAIRAAAATAPHSRRSALEKSMIAAWLWRNASGQAEDLLVLDPRWTIGPIQSILAKSCSGQEPAVDGMWLGMKECRLIFGAGLLLMASGWAAAQGPPPFAPPSPAAQLLQPLPIPGNPPPDPGFAPRPTPVPFQQSERAMNAGFLFGMEYELIKSSLGASLAGGKLDRTVSPSFLLGYRFPSGRSVNLEYTYFGGNSDQTATLTGDPGPTTIHRHVEGHVFDLGVRFLPAQWPLFFRSQWELGARDVNISVYALRPSPTYYSLVSNRFTGAGPRADWRLSWAVFDTGIELFGRVDAAVLFGSNSGGSQQMPAPGIPGTPVSHNASGQVAWNGRWQAGVSYWFPWGLSRFLLAGGYEVEGYYFNHAGQLVTTSSGNIRNGGVRLINKGPFARLEFKY